MPKNVGNIVINNLFRYIIVDVIWLNNKFIINYNFQLSEKHIFFQFINNKYRNQYKLIITLKFYEKNNRN